MDAIAASLFPFSFPVREEDSHRAVALRTRYFYLFIYLFIFFWGGGGGVQVSGGKTDDGRGAPPVVRLNGSNATFKLPSWH